MKISKKQLEQIEKDYQESVNGLAEKYLKENPITEPLEDYVKKVFVDAYNMGIEIINI